jgi:hypothetical protein
LFDLILPNIVKATLLCFILALSGTAARAQDLSLNLDADQGTGQPIRFTSIVRLANGHIILRGFGLPNTSYDFFAYPTINSSTATFLGSPVSNSNGLVTWDDADAVGLTQRFYRFLPATCLGQQTLLGSITAPDPTHQNFVNFAAGGGSVCGPPQACPGVITDTSAYHYDTYSVANTTSSPQCVRVSVDATSCGGSSQGLASYAYVGSYNPGALCANYAGGRNAQIASGTSGSYALTVAAGQTCAVEVEEYVAGRFCASYSVTFGSCAP